MKDKNKRIYACEDNILLFSLLYFTKYHHFVMPTFHKGMYDDLRFKNTVGALWIMFRESSKTTLAKIKVIHAICYKQKRFIIWTSFDQGKAEANLFDIAVELQTNKNLIADFGQLFYEESLVDDKFSKKKSIKEFITANKIKVKAYSTGQSTRGEVFMEFRPDLAILDDIELLKTIVSEPRTAQVIDYIDELLSGLGGDANVLVLGNRLTNSGSITYIEEKVRKLNWKIRDVAVKDSNDKLVWPAKYTNTDKEALEFNKDIKEPKERKTSLETKYKTLGMTVYNREMMNTPLTDEEREFKFEWLSHTFQASDLTDKLLNRFITIDVADSKDKEDAIKKQEHDYTGTTVVDWDIENNWYVRFAKRKRLNAPELIDWIFYLWQTYKPSRIGVEKNAFEDQVKPYLKIKSDELDVYPNVVALKHGGTRKEDRIRGALQGRFQSGKIKFDVDATDDTDKLKEELLDFPKAKHEDISDSLSYIEQVGQRPMIKGDNKLLKDVDREFFEHKKKMGEIKSTVDELFDI